MTRNQQAAIAATFAQATPTTHDWPWYQRPKFQPSTKWATANNDSTASPMIVRRGIRDVPVTSRGCQAKNNMGPTRDGTAWGIQRSDTASQVALNAPKTGITTASGSGAHAAGTPSEILNRPAAAGPAIAAAVNMNRLDDSDSDRWIASSRRSAARAQSVYHHATGSCRAAS